MKKQTPGKWSHLFLFVVSLFLVFLIAGCTQGITTSPEVEDEPIAKRTWTILVYMGADNSLDYAGWVDINEMEKAGSSDSVNIIVQFDHTGANFGEKGAQRYYISRNSDATVGDIKSPEIENLGNTNMGDPDTLVNFIEWGMKNYPANKYAVILWNHGSGWRGDARSSITKGIISDDSYNDELTQLEVKEAFQRIYKFNDSKKLEFIGFDACLMGGIEVVDSLKGFGKYYVGSSRSEPAYGWDYYSTLETLRTGENPSWSGKELSASFVNTYADFNEGVGKTEYTLSGSFLERTDDFVASIDAFAKSAIENIDSQGDNLSEANAATDSVDDSYVDYKDIKLFMENVVSKVDNTDLQSKANSVISSLEYLVLYRVQGSSLVEPRGCLSIWLPSQSYYNSYISEYRKLTFAKDTDWDDFLDLFVVQ